jgi:hypothetical protein
MASSAQGASAFARPSNRTGMTPSLLVIRTRIALGIKADGTLKVKLCWSASSSPRTAIEIGGTTGTLLVNRVAPETRTSGPPCHVARRYRPRRSADGKSIRLPPRRPEPSLARNSTCSASGSQSLRSGPVAMAIVTGRCFGRTASSAIPTAGSRTFRVSNTTPGWKPSASLPSA